MNEREDEKKPVWQTTQYTNLIRYVPSQPYYARIRVCGNLIRKPLKTTKVLVAKLRLSDLDKAERQNAENQTENSGGNLTFGQAVETYKQRINGDASLKPRTKQYHEQRLIDLSKSWPELAGRSSFCL